MSLYNPSLFILWQIRDNCRNKNGKYWIDGNKQSNCLRAFPLLSGPQFSFFTWAQCRRPERRPSAAGGEFTCWILIWIFSTGGIYVLACIWRYAVFTFSSQSPVLVCTFPPLEPVSPASTKRSQRRRRGGGSALQWHFQSDQPAAISSLYLQKSRCHFGAVCLSRRAMLMLEKPLKWETAGLPVQL